MILLLLAAIAVHIFYDLEHDSHIYVEKVEMLFAKMKPEFVESKSLLLSEKNREPQGTMQYAMLVVVDS